MTAGLDMAAMPERTALASIEWAETRAVIRDVICPADDNVILEVIGQTGKTGIDCPFGWPDAFVEFVAAHRSGHVALLPRWPGDRMAPTADHAAHRCRRARQAAPDTAERLGGPDRARRPPAVRS